MQIEVKNRSRLWAYPVTARNGKISKVSWYDEGTVVATATKHYTGNIELESYFHDYEFELEMNSETPVIRLVWKNGEEK